MPDVTRGKDAFMHKMEEKIDLNIAHWCLFAPKRSGMYETVKELIAYENRHYGVFAGMVCTSNKEGGQTDGFLTTQAHDFAMNADVNITHYSEPMYVTELQPKIFAIHGTPEACLWGEEEEPQSKSFSSSIDRIRDSDATIVFSKRHEYMYRAWDRNGKIVYIPKGIDLERYKPEGETRTLNGKPSLLYADVWRQIKSPLMMMYGVEEYHKRNPEVRLHMQSLGEHWRMWFTILLQADWKKFLGDSHLSGFQDFPEHSYRGVDFIISPVFTGEPSRVELEALACGTPTIGWDTNPFEPRHRYVSKAFDPFDMARAIEVAYNELQDKGRDAIRKECRQYAEENYDMANTAAKVVELCRKISK